MPLSCPSFGDDNLVRVSIGSCLIALTDVNNCCRLFTLNEIGAGGKGGVGGGELLATVSVSATVDVICAATPFGAVVATEGPGIW